MLIRSQKIMLYRVVIAYRAVLQRREKKEDKWKMNDKEHGTEQRMWQSEQKIGAKEWSSGVNVNT